MFGTKAETLHFFASRIKSARVLPQLTLTAEDWESDPEVLINKVQSCDWVDQPLIVRSSARAEDSLDQLLDDDV